MPGNSEVVKELQAMRDALAAYRDALDEERWEDADELVADIAEDAKCSLCKRVRQHMAHGQLFLSYTAPDRRPDVATAVIDEADEWIAQLDRELNQATQEAGTA